MNRNLMRQAQELQARLAKAQEELADMTTEITAGGGVVTIVIDGAQKIRSVKIAPEVVKAEDVEMLQDLITAAVNEALHKSQEMAANRLNAITGGLKIPGLG
jgi:DNA-binding YbaB/EbfC family protein